VGRSPAARMTAMISSTRGESAGNLRPAVDRRGWAGADGLSMSSSLVGSLRSPLGPRRRHGPVVNAQHGFLLLGMRATRWGRMAWRARGFASGFHSGFQSARNSGELRRPRTASEWEKRRRPYPCDLIAHSAGGRKVAGSNPVAPTKKSPGNRRVHRFRSARVPSLN
jgi:hypothetical protein